MSSYRRKEKWNYIPRIGNLYIEELLVVANDPLLFVCVDDNYDRYLVMTYDFLDSEFVISKIKPGVLCRMLKNEIPMDESFKSSQNIIYTEMKNNRLSAHMYSVDDFPVDKLPQKGAFFELKFDYIDRYVSLLEKCPQQVQEYVFFHSEVAETRVKYEMNDNENAYELNELQNNYVNDSYSNTAA